jgi:integrase
MAAMILLGINGGLGNTDLGELPLSALDLKGGWLVYPRSKTGIPRRIPLWKETLAAIRKVIDNRREPKDEAAKELLFIGNRGEDYAGGYKGGPISKAFQRTLEKAGFNGRTFYDLRRTFRTIASGAKDLEATRSVMGHSSGHVEERYIQAMPDDERLRAVVNHVRSWLFAKPAKSAKGKGKGVAHE